MKIHIYIFTALFTLYTGTCYSDEWKGWVYPDKKDLSNDYPVGTFNTLEECREASRSLLMKASTLTEGTYECGLNCKPMFPNLSDSAEVCKETKK